MNSTAQTADWIDAILPRMQRETGSFGSEIVTLREGDPAVHEAAVHALSIASREFWCDAPNRVSVMIAPSRFHARASVELGEVVRALCWVSGIAYIATGSATAEAKTTHKRTASPDESYLIGERAERFRRIEREVDTEAALSDLGEQPADLVVEVEHTSYDEMKRGVYRDAGIRELWEAAPKTSKASRRPRIIDLQDPDGCRQIEASNIIPGVRPEGLHGAIAVLQQVNRFGGFVERLARGEPVDQDLLSAAGLKSEDKKGTGLGKPPAQKS